MPKALAREDIEMRWVGVNICIPQEYNLPVFFLKTVVSRERFRKKISLHVSPALLPYYRVMKGIRSHGDGFGHPNPAKGDM